MDNQNLIASDSNQDTGVDETTLAGHAVMPMPGWLFCAAIEGNKEVWESESKEVDNDDHLEVSITMSSQEIKKVAMNYLQSITYMGNTVLHLLATYGHTELVSMICQKDRSMWKKKNKMFETPFHSVAKAGHVETMSKLITFACNEGDQLKSVLREKNKLGETALHEAARHGHNNVVSKLMEVDPLLACEFNKDGVSSLYLADARATRVDDLMVQEILRRLSEHNIDPVYYDGRIYKDVPVSSPDSTVAKGADISKDKHIHFLASAGKVSVVEHLLQHDPSLVYLQDSDGLFPIHLAARAGQIKMIILFMNMFPDSVELLDDHGRNFFHIAAEKNVLDVLSKLALNHIPKQADKSVVTVMKECAVFMAMKVETWSIFQVDKKIRSEDNFTNYMTEMLVTKINETDNEGNTPMHIAAEKGCKTAMKTIWVIQTTAQKMKKDMRPPAWFDINPGPLLGYENIDLDLRNRKELTPFDISVIQMKTSAVNFMGMEQMIGNYVYRHGPRFTSSWFNQVMEIGRQNMMDKLQLVGLGAVLVTTVTFAVAFTLPGGYDSQGSPLLGRKYLFKAFILADTLAFILSALCIASIIYGGLTSINPIYNDGFIKIPLILFSTALKHMILAFGLGVYLLLAPVVKGVGILILAVVGVSTILEFVMIIQWSMIGMHRAQLLNFQANFFSWSNVALTSYVFFCSGIMFVFCFPMLGESLRINL